MITLAIETATTACAVAVRDANGDVRAALLDNDRRHTEVLSQGIHDILQTAGLSPRDLQRIVVDRGPGLFTGLRVGLATASALAQGLGIECCGVTSLEVLAEEAAGLTSREVICLVDGRRGELFAQRFSVGAAVRALDEARVSTPEQVAAGLDGAALVGDGAHRYAELFLAAGATEILDVTVPSPAYALVVTDLRPRTDVSPLYMREADAVAHFTTRSS